MIKDLWSKYLKKGMPRFAKGTYKLTYHEFLEIIKTKNYERIEDIIIKMSAGYILHLEGCLSLETTRSLKKSTVEFWHNEPSSFHKMLENVPNFHRIIDENVSQNYSFRAIKHSAYYFPWNEDITGVRDVVMSRWGKIKVLMGLSEFEYTKNTPISGAVDRIQVVLYPPRYGVLETHVDPYHNQLCFISGYLTTRGEGYNQGGFYAINEQGEKLDLESEMREGDMGVGLATIQHGVSRIDPDCHESEIDWNGSKGRWFLGLYTNDSDEVSFRRTGTSV
jgi:hypothetical protein